MTAQVKDDAWDNRIRVARLMTFSSAIGMWRRTLPSKWISKPAYLSPHLTILPYAAIVVKQTLDSRLHFFSFQYIFEMPVDVFDQWLRTCAGLLGISSEERSLGYGALFLLSLEILILYVISESFLISTFISLSNHLDRMR
jgi:hypothetical protein